MKTIASRDNPLFKRWKLLQTSSAQRRRHGLVLIEGVHLCAAWLAGRGQPDAVIVTPAALANPEVTALWHAVDDGRRIELAEPLFAQLSDVAHGVGIAFEVELPQRALPVAIAADAVILDGVQDAGNVGSILRSAAAAGVSDVFCTPGTAQIWSPKVLRAGMGAHFQLQIVEGVQVAALLPRLKVPLRATSSHLASSLYTADLRGACAWAFGNEGQGVSPGLLAAAAGVAIPQPGGLESLNVAAAAAVCLFEMVRQRG